MPSLYIDRRATKIVLSGEAIVCYENEERIGTIPLAPIDRVLIKGDVQLQASLLAKLGEKGIGVIFLSGRKNTPALFLPQPHNDAERRLLQFELAQAVEFCEHFANAIVSAKLANQRQWLMQQPEFLLLQQQEFAELLAKMTACHNLASLRGIEGYAARIHFNVVAQKLPPELGFEGRNRRPPKDPFNAMLSLTATILHSEAVLALYSAGLDPFIGFFHSLDFGRESLACDMIEPLRPLAIAWLVELFNQQTLTFEHFSNTQEGCFLGKDGRVIFYTEFEKVANNWRKRLQSQCYQLVRLMKKYRDLNNPLHTKNEIITQLFADFSLNQLLDLPEWEKE